MKATTSDQLLLFKDITHKRHRLYKEYIEPSEGQQDGAEMIIILQHVQKHFSACVSYVFCVCVYVTSLSCVCVSSSSPDGYLISLGYKRNTCTIK